MEEYLDYLWLLPVINLAFIPFSFVISYVVATMVSRNISPFFPMISDCGQLIPERYTFTILLNVSCFTIGLQFFYRRSIMMKFFSMLKREETHLAHISARIMLFLQTACVIVCLLCILVVASAEFIDNPMIHNGSAFILFATLLLMGLYDTLLSTVTRKFVNKFVLAIRWTLFLANVVSFGFFIVATVLIFSTKDMRPKSLGEEGAIKIGVSQLVVVGTLRYYALIVWSASEWAFIAGVGFHFFTFIYELRQFKLVRPKLVWKFETAEL